MRHGVKSAATTKANRTSTVEEQDLEKPKAVLSKCWPKRLENRETQTSHTTALQLKGKQSQKE